MGFWMDHSDVSWRLDLTDLGGRTMILVVTFLFTSFVHAKAILITIWVGSVLLAAEYQGSNIDGEQYDALAKNRTQGSQWYRVKVEFDGDEVTIYLPDGGLIRLDLDDEEIDDPSDIDARDGESGDWWILDVDGL